jgi:hypothetical protein
MILMSLLDMFAGFADFVGWFVPHFAESFG